MTIFLNDVTKEYLENLQASLLTQSQELMDQLPVSLREQVEPYCDQFVSRLRSIEEPDASWPLSIEGVEEILNELLLPEAYSGDQDRFRLAMAIQANFLVHELGADDTSKLYHVVGFAVAHLTEMKRQEFYDWGRRDNQIQASSGRKQPYNQLVEDISHLIAEGFKLETRKELIDQTFESLLKQLSRMGWTIDSQDFVVGKAVISRVYKNEEKPRKLPLTHRSLLDMKSKITPR